MINVFSNWWQLRAIKKAIIQGNTAQAQRLIRARKNRGIKLTLLETLFIQNQGLLLQQKQDQPSSLIPRLESPILADKKFIQHINQQFNLIYHNNFTLQPLGIDRSLFETLEAKLADFLTEEFTRNSANSEDGKQKIQQAYQDLNKLKRGLDPDYNLPFSPHVYLLQYFVENVYSAYLAYFLIYQQGYFKNDLKILDIAAGPGTMLFGF